MKIHPPILSGVISALSDIFNHGYFADKVIERHFKAHPKWGSRDRRFFAEAVYDLVRWWRKYLAACEIPWKEDHYVRFRGAADAKPTISEDEIKQLIVGWMLNSGYPIPSWMGVAENSLNQFSEKWKTADQTRVTKLSLSDWMDQQGYEELGERWSSSIDSMNQVAPLFLRVNSLKSDLDKVQESLETEEVKTERVANNASLLKVIFETRRPNVFRTKPFQKGWFEVQDGGSQKIAPFLKAEPGQRVIDACAGAGGKSLHLAGLMKNQGRIISMDVEEWKLKELRKRSSRAGVDIIETRHIDSTKAVKRLKESADRLLLDVPCTGLGVLRRNPDTKWRLTKDRYDEILRLQKDILQRYSQMVRPGGKMVYATCSLLPSENETQVLEFLKANENWSLEEEKHIWPGEANEDFDGFYMARLSKK